MSALDLFVCSSLWEGGPLTVMEAMIAGIPVVSTNVGIVPEIIEPGQTGEIAERASPELLAESILIALRRLRNGGYALDRATDRVLTLTDLERNTFLLDSVLKSASKRKIPAQPLAVPVAEKLRF